MSLLLWGVSAALAGPLDTVRVTALNEAIALPFTQVPIRALHPGLAVAGSLVTKRGSHAGWALDAEIGAYHHRAIETAWYAMPVWRGTWWPHQTVGLQLIAGLGMKHALAPQPTYVMEDGVAERRGSLGHLEATLQLGPGLVVQLNDQWALLAQYRGGVDGPFSSSLGMPVMTHTSLHVGVEVRP